MVRFNVSYPTDRPAVIHYLKVLTIVEKHVLRLMNLANMETTHPQQFEIITNVDINEHHSIIGWKKPIISGDGRI